MRAQKLVLMVVLSQLSVACIATPYEPTKLPPARKGVAPPKSSPIDEPKLNDCKYKFNKQQSLEEIATLAAQMQQECSLSHQQVLQLAQKEFEIN